MTRRRIPRALQARQMHPPSCFGQRSMAHSTRISLKRTPRVPLRRNSTSSRRHLSTMSQYCCTRNVLRLQPELQIISADRCSRLGEEDTESYRRLRVTRRQTAEQIWHSEIPMTWKSPATTNFGARRCPLCVARRRAMGTNEKKLEFHLALRRPMDTTFLGPKHMWRCWKAPLVLRLVLGKPITYWDSYEESQS